MELHSRSGALHHWRPLTPWIVFSAVLHLAWETAQLPLYALWLHPDGAYIVYAVLHCTAGDVLIATGVYVGAALGTREAAWPLARPWRGIAIAIALAVLYTAWSEWRNVYDAANWQYRPAMPLVFGIGLSPLLQWVVVPAATLALLRRRGRRIGMEP